MGTNTHQPFRLLKKGLMKGWWLSVQTTTNTHQPSPSHPRLTDNHQHPPTLSFVKKRMDEGLVFVCTDNHQHPPTLPQPSSFYRQPPTPTNPPPAILFLQTTTNTRQPFHFLKQDGCRVGGCLYRQPPTPTNPPQPSSFYRQPPTPTNPPPDILVLQTTTNTHQPFRLLKKRIDEGLVVVCTDNHQHPPTLPQPSFLYRQPLTPTNPFIC